MVRTLPNCIKNNQQKFFASLVLFFVLIGSCPIKTSIRNLIGIPVNTEQSTPKSMHALQVTSTEKCADGEINKVKILQTNSSSTGGLLPVAFFMFTFIYALGFPLAREQSHPQYGNLKIPGTLPVFLQYRRLII